MTGHGIYNLCLLFDPKQTKQYSSNLICQGIRSKPFIKSYAGSNYKYSNPTVTDAYYFRHSSENGILE